MFLLQITIPNFLCYVSYTDCNYEMKEISKNNFTFL